MKGLSFKQLGQTQWHFNKRGYNLHLMHSKQPIKELSTPTYETELHGSTFLTGVVASQVFHGECWMFTSRLTSFAKSGYIIWAKSNHSPEASPFVGVYYNSSLMESRSHGPAEALIHLLPEMAN